MKVCRLLSAYLQTTVFVLQVKKRKSLSMCSMKAENPYVKLFKLILSVDIASFFDLVDVTKKTG
jgi:hypothetical protein